MNCDIFLYNTTSLIITNLLNSPHGGGHFVSWRPFCLILSDFAFIPYTLTHTWILGFMITCKIKPISILALDFFLYCYTMYICCMMLHSKLDLFFDSLR